MSAITVTYDEARALRPCESGLKSAAKLLGGAEAWNAKPATIADLHAAGVPYDNLKWLAWELANKGNDDTKRRLRLWFADCAAHVLHIYEKKGKSAAPRKAIIAARARARGEISAAAAADAYAAAYAAADDAYADAYAAAAATAADAYAAAATAVDGYADAYATDAYAAAAAATAADTYAYADAYAAYADADAAARSREETWQADRLVAWFGDQEPEDWPLPAVPSV